MKNVRKSVSRLASFKRSKSGKSSAQKKPEAAYEAFQDGAGTPANETKEAPSANGFSEHKDSNSLEDDLDDSRIVSSKGAFDEVDDEGDEGDEGAPAGVLADIIITAALASADIVDGDVRRPADDAPVDGGGNEPASENAAAELCFHEGTQAHADGRLDDAIKQFNYAIGLDPTQSHYYHHLAHSLQEGDRLDESVEAYKSMLKIDPGNHDGWYDMGYIQQQLGNAADAAASFSRALELNPVDKDALIFLGMSFMSQGEYPNAIDAYERALEIDPSCVTSHYNLGTAFLNSKPESNRSAEDYHRAGHHFHEAIRVHPDYADAYFNLALCYQGCGEHQDALDTFQHALELEPKMQEAADAINAIQHAMAQEVADRQRKADAARNIAHGQRLLKSPTETGGGLGASSRNIVREETKSNDSPPVVPVLTTKYPAEQAAAAGAAAAPPPRQHEYDKLRRALELERMRAIKLEEQLASQAQVHSAQVAVLRQTQESNDRVKNHRDDLEGFKEAAASRNHAAEVEIRMQKLLANFKTLQTQHEASLRGKQQLQRNHDALLEANRREKATVAELREQTTREQAEMSALRVVSDAQHRELTRLRKVEEEQKTFHQQHSQDQALVQQVQAEKSALVATLASTEKQHRQKVQEMVQAYGESTKRLQLLEQATREDSDAKVVALRTDQTAILSALKAAHAAELDQAKATRAEEGAVALGKLRARQLRSIVQQWIGKKQHRGWNTWKTVYLSQKLRAEFTTTAEALETKHKSASEEMVEGHRVANTRALLEKDRVIADQQVLLETRSRENDSALQSHRLALVKGALVRMMRARVVAGWSSWRLVLAESRAQTATTNEVAALGTKVADLEGEREQLQRDHDTVDAHRRKMISQHAQLQQELKVLASDKQIAESGHESEMAGLRQQLEALAQDRSVLSGAHSSLKTESEASVAGLESKVAAMHIEQQKLTAEKQTAQKQREELYEKVSALESEFATSKADAELQGANLQTAVAALEKQRQELLNQSAAMNVEILNLRSESDLLRSKHESQLGAARERYDALVSMQEESNASMHDEAATWKEQRERLKKSHEDEVAKLRKAHASVSETLAAEIAGLRRAMAERNTIPLSMMQGNNRFAAMSDRVSGIGVDSAAQSDASSWGQAVIEPKEARFQTAADEWLSSAARTSKLPMFFSEEGYMEAVEMVGDDEGDVKLSPAVRAHSSPQPQTPEPPQGVSNMMPHTRRMIDLDISAPGTPPVDALTSVYSALAAAERAVGEGNTDTAGQGGADSAGALVVEKSQGGNPREGETYRVLFPSGTESLGIEIDSNDDGLPSVFSNTTANPLPRIGDLVIGVGGNSLVGARNPRIRLAELVGIDSQNSDPDHKLALVFRRTEAGNASEKQAWLDSLPKTLDEDACHELQAVLGQSTSLNWSGPVALWDGVTIEETSSRVTSLKLHGLGVKLQLSSLAEALARFPQLTELVLDDNPGLRGALSDLRGLTNLRELSLDACSSITGDIVAIGRSLTNLESLDLTGCTAITGDLRSLVSLSGLRLLCLGDCARLTGSIVSLHKMAQLRHLDLHQVPVSGNIKVLAGLCLLETATVTSSRVVGRLGNIANLTNLQVLTLSGTRVEGNFSTVGKFTSMVKLEFDGCSKVEGQLKSLGKCTTLEELSLQGTGLRGTLADLEPLKELSSVNMKGCKGISGSLLAATGFFPNLRVMNVASTRIRCSQKEKAAFEAEANGVEVVL